MLWRPFQKSSLLGWFGRQEFSRSKKRHFLKQSKIILLQFIRYGLALSENYIYTSFYNQCLSPRDGKQTLQAKHSRMNTLSNNSYVGIYIGKHSNTPNQPPENGLDTTAHQQSPVRKKWAQTGKGPIVSSTLYNI